MALNRTSTNRFSATIWPGFVDAMTALLMVMMFVVTIFVIVQSVLREEIDNQSGLIDDQSEQISKQQRRLNALGAQVGALSSALSTAEERNSALEDQRTAETIRAQTLESQLQAAERIARERSAQISRLSSQLDTSQSELLAAQSRLTDFEAEVATLIAARAQVQSEATALKEALDAQSQRASAAELAIASARNEINAQAEQARLAAARREAFEAIIADLRSQKSRAEKQSEDLSAALTDAEAQRLAEAEAAAALREKLETADTELTAMTLALEESRKKAEETLTMLAAANAAKEQQQSETQDKMAEVDRVTALLNTARASLTKQEELRLDDQRRLALLSEQVSTLTNQLGSLQALLDIAGSEQESSELRVAELGQQLNAALLRAAEEKERRLALEEKARLAAEAEVKDLARYRSEFFGRMSEVLSGIEGVKVVGDRFVFQSEVLFPLAQAGLSPAGREQIAQVAEKLKEVADEIPAEIDWIIRVDGHTDSLPLSGSGEFRDNWELSQARALAVVRYMINDLNFPAGRLAATGFADTSPIADESTAAGRARNRRIELKLTER